MATTEADVPTFAWSVHFVDGTVSPDTKTFKLNVWCVRGPMQESVY